MAHDKWKLYIKKKRSKRDKGDVKEKGSPLKMIAK